jgi:predicted PurR-regulated permease PerM
VVELSVQRAFFVTLLLLVTVAFLWLIRGFLQPIFWAAALAIVFHPVHRQIELRLDGRASLAALLSLVLIVLMVILPLVAVVGAIAAEASALYQRLLAGEIDLGRAWQWIVSRVPQLTAWLAALNVDSADLQAQLSTAAVAVSRFIATRALAFGQDTLRIAVYSFLMLYLLFFFLRDGPRLLEGLIRALPLGDERERLLLQRFAEVSRATIKGTLVIGIVQGFIGGVAFWALGLGAPVLWGMVMAFLSLLPAVGPALVWVPAAIYLIVTGQIVSGLVLVVIGALVISLIDNLLRPMLVGRDTRMPDYLILLATLGGLAAFGLAGIVIGPIIAALFLSVWQMAEHEFGESTAPVEAGKPTEEAPAKRSRPRPDDREAES